MARATTNGKTDPQADLQAQITALKTDIASLAGTIKDMGAAQKDHLVAAASNKSEALRAKGEAALHDAQQTAGKVINEAETKVRDNPAAAVGIAAGLGFVVGLVAGRK